MLEFHIFTSAKLSFHCVSFSSDEFFRYLFRLKLYIYLTNDKHARNIWNFQFSSPVVCSSDEMISLLYTENSERHGARKKRKKGIRKGLNSTHDTMFASFANGIYIWWHDDVHMIQQICNVVCWLLLGHILISFYFFPLALQLWDRESVDYSPPGVLERKYIVREHKLGGKINRHFVRLLGESKNWKKNSISRLAGRRGERESVDDNQCSRDGKFTQIICFTAAYFPIS